MSASGGYEGRLLHETEIQGHTDAIGGEAYNEHLGLERAAMRRYLS